MSSIDDILFAPINQTSQSDVDFLCKQIKSSLWSWKPVSERAHAWMSRWFDDVYRSLDSEGWAYRFSDDAGPTPGLMKLRCMKELVDENYVFVVQE